MFMGEYEIRSGVRVRIHALAVFVSWSDHLDGQGMNLTFERVGGRWLVRGQTAPADFVASVSLLRTEQSWI